jgi:nucleotide-binding universal stress UspA family protein
MSRKRILVGVDGSEHALEAVRYVGGILPPQGAEIILFHVMTRIPESFWDLERSSAYRYRIADVSAWEKQQQRIIQDFMVRATSILTNAGISKDLVIVKVQERKDGIARDIVSESFKGYDAVVVGRRGLSKLKDIVLGSVADRLIGKLTHVPIWVVGGKPSSRKVLMSMDASEGSMQAVDYVAALLSGSYDASITLFHAIRGLDVFLPGFGDSFGVSHEMEGMLERAQKELEEAEEEMSAAFREAENRMAGAGFDPNRVDRKIVKGVSSRAGAIAQEADEGGFGTIVVGRRGLSKVEEFFMGRVSNKVLHLAKDKAVWVVS